MGAIDQATRSLCGDVSEVQDLTASQLYALHSLLWAWEHNRVEAGLWRGFHRKRGAAWRFKSEDGFRHTFQKRTAQALLARGLAEVVPLADGAEFLRPSHLALRSVQWAGRDAHARGDSM